MKVYLIRHGDAASAETDSARPLSAQGRQEARRIGRFFSRTQPAIQTVWHSDKARARETAEILIEHSGLAAAAEEMQGLRPDDDVAPVAGKLQGAEENLCIVSHLPFVGLLASLLLGGDARATRWAFETCGALCLERDGAGRWWVVWFVVPAMLGEG